ncbi:MAG: bifunctional diaminohydroxyphosphoribosylaminopyrimidine deaminase/5-amino-6-(5-phosphoribosylamino)uracil reductase RibD [Desulfovibrionaceae bacterium]|nr:bifunctional diaminohydroxyphosphoribosylaminopyrimidine deaminase/5-amino-6-(5-phosphoribosylamino)uracil reductase RibD [Desulfovibrionaceae bacterium]
MKSFVVSDSWDDFMLEAIRLSRDGFGRTAPNPMVGALLVRDGRIMAKGWHRAWGEAHAELDVLEDARRQGLDPASCTLVVTLEPCNHRGRTPPCVDAILEAGIRHVVIGVQDPNPVAAGGAERLAGAGVRVEFGAVVRECLDNIADFLHFRNSRRAWLTLKLASTLDGRIADHAGRSRGISSTESLEYVHWLRGRVQAVLVGGGTFYADNPMLTSRGSNGNLPDQPLAVVVASHLPEKSSAFSLLRERAGSTIFFTDKAAAEGARGRELRSLGVRVHAMEEMGGLRKVLEVLRQDYACHYVLCEGGGRLGFSLLRQGLADEILVHLAPLVLGDNQGKPLFDGGAPQSLGGASRLRLVSMERRGRDAGLRFFPE